MPRDGTMPASQSMPDSLEIALAQEWQAAQLGQQHVATAINNLGEAYRLALARIAELERQLAESATTCNHEL